MEALLGKNITAGDFRRVVFVPRKRVLIRLGIDDLHTAVPVKQVLYADFGVKKDLDELAEVLPDNIFAMFLCHGIALNSDGSNTMEVQKVNFLGHKYFLEKALSKIADQGSVLPPARQGLSSHQNRRTAPVSLGNQAHYYGYAGTIWIQREEGTCFRCVFRYGPGRRQIAVSAGSGGVCGLPAKWTSQCA